QRPRRGHGTPNAVLAAEQGQPPSLAFKRQLLTAGQVHRAGIVGVLARRDIAKVRTAALAEQLQEGILVHSYGFPDLDLDGAAPAGNALVLVAPLDGIFTMVALHPRFLSTGGEAVDRGLAPPCFSACFKALVRTHWGISRQKPALLPVLQELD